MHKDLSSLLNDTKQDVTKQFSVQNVPDDLDPEEYVDAEIS